MNIRYHPAAEAEILQAIDYYQDIEWEIAQGFADELHKALDRIIELPKAWPIITGNIRRVLFRRFPYGIIYTENNGEILILAVMNLNRKPHYWKGRKNE